MKQASPRKKPVRRRVPVAESYLFSIDSATPDYSFGTNDVPREPGAYTEYVHPKIEATCLFPKKFEGRKTAFTMIGHRWLEQELTKPTASRRDGVMIGTLTMRGAQSEYLGSLPHDAAMTLPALILLQGIRFIYLSGEPTYRGTAGIRYIAFYRDYDMSEL